MRTSNSTTISIAERPAAIVGAALASAAPRDERRATDEWNTQPKEGFVGKNKKKTVRVSPTRPSMRKRISPLVVTALVVVLGAAFGWAMYGRNASSTTAADTPPASPSPSSPSSSSPSSFEPTVANTVPAPGPAPEGMIWIPGGEFSMGANEPPDMHEVGMQATEDSRPIHRVYVDGFFIDRTVVTNAQFAAFVKATGYITLAERAPLAKDFPTAPPENLIAGSVVFTAPAQPVPLTITFSGGRTSRTQAGVTRWDRRATSRARTTIRSFMWRTKMPRPTRSGRGSGCRRRPNGNSPPEVG